MSRVHGKYGTYSSGCRCDECKAAKAAYSRQKRREARELAEQNRLPEGEFTHGTRYGYEMRGCRCQACVSANRFRHQRPRNRIETVAHHRIRKAMLHLGEEEGERVVLHDTSMRNLPYLQVRLDLFEELVRDKGIADKVRERYKRREA